MFLIVCDMIVFYPLLSFLCSSEISYLSARSYINTSLFLTNWYIFDSLNKVIIIIIEIPFPSYSKAGKEAVVKITFQGN